MTTHIKYVKKANLWCVTTTSGFGKERTQKQVWVNSEKEARESLNGQISEN